MTRSDVARAAGLGLLAFVLIGSYELIRPAADALYIKTYGSDALPYAWLGVAAMSFVVVGVYSRVVHRFGLLRLLALAATIAAGVFIVVLSARSAEIPGATFVMYVAKDVYIVVLVEIFWTYANLVYDRNMARWVYGLFCALGSGGGAAGAEVTRWVSKTYGADTATWLLIPVLFAIAIACTLVKSDHRAQPKTTTEKPSFTAGLTTVRGSRYLLTMLVLIGSVQLVITLVDYQFNAVAEATYVDENELSAMFSRVASIINLSSVALQLATGPILRIIGIGATLVAIPVLLGGSLGTFLVMPHFSVLIVAKILSKCLDYSLFRAAKEILYIPLDRDEKTKGKAVVDMLTYRVAKGFASLTVLGLVALSVAAYVGYLTLALIALWLFAAVQIARRYRERTAA